MKSSRSDTSVLPGAPMRQDAPQALLIAYVLIAPLLVCWLARGAQADPVCSDVALVLAVDTSASVSSGEFLLEKRGIAVAFRDPTVLKAIERAGKVMVSAVFWGDDDMPKTQSNWVSLDDQSGADQFARDLEVTPRQVTGDTGLGAGLATALAKIMSPDVCAVRKIINVSGDGEESSAVRGKHRPTLPSQVRDLATMANVEINALSISNDNPELAQYYSRNVITGPDAFVMDVHEYTGFADAIRRKLIREISPRAVSELPPLPEIERLN